MTYRVGDAELASRLALFLWSSIPDDELLDLVGAGRLREPDTLEQQVRRMLADPRASVLVKHFAGQWLYLHNLPRAATDVAPNEPDPAHDLSESRTAPRS